MNRSTLADRINEAADFAIKNADDSSPIHWALSAVERLGYEDISDEVIEEVRRRVAKQTNERRPSETIRQHL